MKYYVFSIVGSCENNSGCNFYLMPSTIACSEQELKEIFKGLRNYLKESYKNTSEGPLKTYANYKYGISITIIDAKKDKYKYKIFYINPLNLR